MTLPDLKRSAADLARKNRVTLAGLFMEYGILERTVNFALNGSAIDLVTAKRMLPLVARLSAPGEPAALECNLPTGAAVVMSPETFAELRAKFFSHQPN